MGRRAGGEGDGGEQDHDGGERHAHVTVYRRHTPRHAARLS
jgi:hypothetical protein